MNVFVVIPVYNEAKVLSDVIQSLSALPYQIVIVDDGSNDNLAQLVSGKNIFYLRHKINLGQGASLQTGTEFALELGADYIVHFDGDGQHQAADIEKLLGPLISQQYDVSLGSRFKKSSSHNMPMRRKLLLQVARYINFLLTGSLLSDAHNGLRAMTANAAQTIRLTENRMAHATQILYIIRKNKLRYVEVPVSIVYSEYSLAKGQTVWSGFRIFFDLLLNKIFR